MIEQHVDNEPVLQTSLSAMDIWAVGVELINLAFQPCHFISFGWPGRIKLNKEYPAYYEVLREMVLSIGGETRIPIGRNRSLDLASLVGLKRRQAMQARSRFEIPLMHEKGPCNISEFELLRDATTDDFDNLHSIHPFLNFSDSWNSNQASRFHRKCRNRYPR